MSIIFLIFFYKNSNDLRNHCQNYQDKLLSRNLHPILHTYTQGTHSHY